MRRHAAVLAFFLLVAVPSYAAITGVVMDEDGKPLAAARVSIYAQETPKAQSARLFSQTPERPPLTQVDSDAYGRFNVATKLPVAEVVVRAAGFGQWSTRADRDDDLGAIALRKAPMRTGKITADGKPVAGATVVWTGNGEYITTTGTDGRYSVPDPTKWASEVALIHPDHAGITEPAAPPTASSAAVDRSFPKSVAVSGKVVGSDGKTPVAGATVTIGGAPPATSGQDGTFTFPHVNDKWTVVRATLGDRIGTRVRSGTAQPVIRLSKAGVINGTVRDTKTRLPLAGVDMRLRPGSRFDPSAAIVVAFSDDKGNFALEGVPAGTYTLAAIRPGYRVEPVSVTVTEGQKVSQAMLGTQLGRISGTVVDEQKRAVARASISSRTLNRQSMMMFDLPTPGERSTSAPDGTFVIRVRPDVDVELGATRKGYPSARSSALKLAPGERRSGVVLTIPTGMPVTGRVTNADGKPLADVAVQAYESNPNSSAFVVRMMLGGPRGQDDTVKTAKDGFFSLRLKEGAYDLGFRLEGFAGKVARAVQVSATTKPLEITLQPGVEITGRVVRGGQGIPEVRVFSVGDGASAMAETAADGSFRLTDLVPGPMRLSINKPDEFIQQMKMVTAPAADLVIEVPPGGRITGRVVDKSTHQAVTTFEAGVGAPRGGGGLVMITPTSMRPFTSDDGSFVLENVPAGPTQLSVRAAGYTASNIPNLTVEEGKTLPDVTVEMDHGVRLVGRVTGPDGSALGGASVRPDPMAGRTVRLPGSDPVATTDQNGDYALEALEPGERTMVFSLAGYLPERKTVSLSGDEMRLDVRLSTGMRVNGSVVTDAGVPVPDADVYAASAAQQGPSFNALTDQNGTFFIDGLAPGRYTFTARKSGQPTGEIRDFDVSSGAPVRITLRSGGVIYGQVTGLPSEEVQQTVVNAATSSGGGGSASVDATGYYRIEGVPVGTVRVSARTGSGFAGGRSSAMQSVQVEAGSQVKVDIAFKADTVVRGRITRNGQPVDGAMVSFYPKDAQAQTNARTSSNSSGEYEVSGLDDATYNVTVVDLQRSSPFTTTYQVRGSGTFDVDMKSAALRGRVTTSSGDPVWGAMVDVREGSDSGAGMRFALRSAQTDATGAFTIDSVPPGSYSVSAAKTGYGTKVVQTTVTAEGSDVTITLSRNPGIVVSVVDGRDGRPLAAFVHVMDLEGHVIYETAPFGGSSTEPQKLPLDPGTYRATIDAYGYASSTVSLTSPSTPTIALTPGGSIAVHSKGSELRRARLLGADGRAYARGFGGSGIFTIDPSPGVTMLNNVAPGMYTLQILGPAGEVQATAPVAVQEGQTAQVSL